MKTCNECQTESPDGHKFCPNCGHKLFASVIHDMTDVAGVALPGEMKPEEERADTMQLDATAFGGSGGAEKGIRDTQCEMRAVKEGEKE